MLRQKNFMQSNWLIKLLLWKNIELRIVGISSTFRGLTFFTLWRSAFNDSRKSLNDVTQYD